MATRTRAQRTGHAAEDFVRVLIDGHLNWLARSQDRDFGVDLEAELAIPVEDNQRLAGKLIKIQVKGSESWEARGGGIAVSLDREYLAYVEQFRLPVILVAADVSTKKAWFLWLQQWLLENEVRLARAEPTATVTVHIPDHQTLSGGLNGPLQRIARGEETTAMVLALRELAVAATAAANSVIFDSVLALLGKVDAPSRTWTVQKTIDALIGLGPQVAMWQTQHLIPQILAIVDRVGDALTQEQIVRLVARGETYSRAGLYGLSRLYDHWPDHARALDLPATFRTMGIEPVAWYCDLREHYPDLDSVALWSSLGSRQLPETRFGCLILPDDNEVRQSVLTKWPTRGDSVFLDYLVWADPSAHGDP